MIKKKFWFFSSSLISRRLAMMKIKRVFSRVAAGLALSALFMSPVLFSSGTSSAAATFPALAASSQQSPTLVSTTSDGPRFNFLPGDFEMLQVAKTTAGSSWVDPLDANIGDRVAFMFYFHNGMLNTVAHNTSLRVDLPNYETNQIKAKSLLWSDETDPITDTVVNNQIVGSSGATINLPSNGRIEYVPGSSKLFTYDTGAEVVTTLPDGIIMNGVNIGDVQGCWQYSGIVTFLADIKGHASLTLDKEVSVPGGEWQRDITVRAGDTVAYRLTLQNTGNITATLVTAKDQLPSYMSYVPNSTKIWNLEFPNGTPAPGDGGAIFGTGIPIPDMAPGSNGVTYVTYETRIDPNIPAGWWALVNVARVYLNGVEQDQDQATVRVFGENRGLAIQKVVVGPDGGLREQIDARIGDIVTYHITVANTGNVTLNNVTVRDVLPVFSSFIPGSVRVNGNTFSNSDQLVDGSGLNFGSLNPDCKIIITLQVKIEGCPPLGGYQTFNTAYTRADGVTEISDTAIVIINVVQPPLPVI